ncbi:MAG: (2Fe-2S) ferredoxin domain-containing protein [Thermoflexales bacterium]|nr:(2Fe-2S) ferredoxin domain-containing protein [Thermoflexales bacterium]
MPAVKSLEELRKLREEAIQKRKAKTTSGDVQITVAMGTCGIAAGARDTMRAVLDEIEANNLTGVIVKQTGCIGLCELEPIVMVEIGGQPKVTYGKVNVERARQIMKEHVVGGKVLSEYVIQSA